MKKMLIISLLLIVGCTQKPEQAAPPVEVGQVWCSYSDNPFESYESLREITAEDGVYYQYRLWYRSLLSGDWKKSDELSTGRKDVLRSGYVVVDDPNLICQLSQEERQSEPEAGQIWRFLTKDPFVQQNTCLEIIAVKDGYALYNRWHQSDPNSLWEKSFSPTGSMSTDVLVDVYDLVDDPNFLDKRAVPEPVASSPPAYPPMEKYILPVSGGWFNRYGEGRESQLYYNIASLWRARTDPNTSGKKE